MRKRLPSPFSFSLLLLTAVLLSAQPAGRHATTIRALLAYPVFFHQKQVVVRGELVEGKDGSSLALAGADGDRVPVIATQARPAEPRVEARGELWDVGRLTPDDPRLTGLDIRSILRLREDERWPAPGERLLLRVTALAGASPFAAPTLRSIALDPSRYTDQRVTITGRFRGRNLYGDLPNAPGKSKWDFVLQLGDASLWVAGIRPRGSGFNLDVSARVDTNKWLEVSGTVQHLRGLVWIQGDLVRLGRAPEAAPEPEPPRAVAPVEPPPQVVFSAPTQDETDVSANTTVRVQFSRGMDPASFKGRVRLSYSTQVSAQRGEPQPPMAPLATAYDPASRVLTIRFERPLERFRTVTIQLLEGITAVDGTPLKPWTLNFSLGG